MLDHVKAVNNQSASNNFSELLSNIHVELFDADWEGRQGYRLHTTSSDVSLQHVLSFICDDVIRIKRSCSGLGLDQELAFTLPKPPALENYMGQGRKFDQMMSVINQLEVRASESGFNVRQFDVPVLGG